MPGLTVVRQHPIGGGPSCGCLFCSSLGHGCGCVYRPYPGLGSLPAWGLSPPAPGSLATTPSRSAGDPQPALEEAVSRPDDMLRPQRLDDYIGQSELKQVLGIAVEAALVRGDALDHVLLYGPPGLGKSTMAMVLAEEMGVQCKVTSALALERSRDIVGLLVNLQPRDLLFIDEIHRLNRVAEELL